MRITVLFAVLILSAMVWSCGASTPGSAGTHNTSDHSSPGPSNQAAATSGDGTFSATIDGKPASGKGTDELQLTNEAFTRTEPNGNKTDYFLLTDSTKNSKGEPNYSIRFFFPPQTGTKSVTQESPDHERYVIAVYLNVDPDHLAIYNSDSITVAINTLTASRVSGTFSGQFKVSSDTPRAEKKEITVTDGKFDIPFSTSNLRPF
jgi:hypothetical protein